MYVVQEKLEAFGEVLSKAREERLAKRRVERKERRKAEAAATAKAEQEKLGEHQCTCTVLETGQLCFWWSQFSQLLSPTVRLKAEQEREAMEKQQRERDEVLEAQRLKQMQREKEIEERQKERERVDERMAADRHGDDRPPLRERDTDNWRRRSPEPSEESKYPPKRDEEPRRGTYRPPAIRSGDRDTGDSWRSRDERPDRDRDWDRRGPPRGRDSYDSPRGERRGDDRGRRDFDERRSYDDRGRRDYDDRRGPRDYEDRRPPRDEGDWRRGPPRGEERSRRSEDWRRDEGRDDDRRGPRRDDGPRRGRDDDWRGRDDDRRGRDDDRRDDRRDRGWRGEESGEGTATRGACPLGWDRLGFIASACHMLARL